MKILISSIISLGMIPSVNALITEKRANELVEQEKNKIKNEITQQFQQEKSKLESDLATAQTEQRASAETLKMCQEDNQRLQEEVSTKDKTINDNNQKIQELQGQIDELKNIKSQLEQKTIEINNLTKTSNDEIARINSEKDKKIKELAERNTALQTQSQQQINEINIKTTEEINRMQNEMEQKNRNFEEQKRTLQNQSQQQMAEITNRTVEEINRIRSECEQKVRELENQKNSQADTIKSQEDTIKVQNLKIDELIKGSNATVTSHTPIVNAAKTLTLLDCSQFANRFNDAISESSEGNIPVKELSEIDLRKTENRCLNEISVIQQNVQQGLVDTLVKQQKVIDDQKNKDIVWSQVNADDLELDSSTNQN